MAHAADVRSGTEAVSAEEFAARTGAKITLLGVTGGGGMIELRYQVVDPDKASLLLHQEDKRPILVAEDTGRPSRMLSRPHNHKAELNLGGTYFFIMANTPQRHPGRHEGDGHRRRRAARARGGPGVTSWPGPPTRRAAAPRASGLAAPWRALLVAVALLLGVATSRLGARDPRAVGPVQRRDGRDGTGRR